LKGLLGTSLAGLFTGFYGGFVEPDLRLRVQNWALQPPGWPRGRKLRLVMVADLHAGWPNMSVARVQDAVDLANAQDADLVLLMGDYRASHKWQMDLVPIETSARLLAGLRARLGVYAILGNHDWWDHIRQTRGAEPPTHTQVVLEGLGIPLLINRAVKLDGFWLAGLDSQAGLQTLKGHRRDWVGRADLRGTLAQVTDDDPVLLLAHEPDIFAQMPDRVALTLSGHTHGGQVRVGPWVPVVPSQYGSRYAYGPVREGARDLVVSGGLGCSGFPVRFGVPPEITVVDLS
jgi:predicted MPP superfamily phosphohydrolase